MKKSILNIGKALNKAEQKSVTGGCFNPTGCPNNPCGRCLTGSLFDTTLCECVLTFG